MTAAATRPVYCPPWTHGAKAYPEADTLAGVAEGMKRRRKPVTMRVPVAGVADVPCASCGIGLADEYLVNAGTSAESKHRDAAAFFDCDPRTKRFVARHYYCAWTSSLTALYNQARRYA